MYKALVASLPIPNLPMLMRRLRIINSIVPELNTIRNRNPRVLNLSKPNDVRITVSLRHGSKIVRMGFMAKSE
jgi:hypothetical protein